MASELSAHAREVGVNERVLRSMPALAKLYAAAAPQVLRKVKAVGAEDLPSFAAVVKDVDLAPDRLVSYQRLMGATLRDSCPSVYLHGVGFPAALWLMSQPEFPLPLLGMVHLSNRVVHSRPVDPRERVDVRAEALELAPHHAGTTVTIRTTLSVAGEPVWRGDSVYLAKGVQLRGAETPQAPQRTPFQAPRVTGRWRLGADIGRRYAEVMGDFNPIHLSWVSAKLLGLRAPIAHGMYLAGRALAQLEPHDDGFAWEISFQTPVFLPGTVAYSTGARAPSTGVSFSGWDAKRNRPHFEGRLTRKEQTLTTTRGSRR